MCQQCLDAVHKYWPGLSDEDQHAILWSGTAYPFATPEYTAEQLRELAEKSGGNLDMALAIADEEAAIFLIGDDMEIVESCP